MDASSSLSKSQEPNLSDMSAANNSRATSAISALHCGAVQTARSQSAGLFWIVEGGCDDAPSVNSGDERGVGTFFAVL